MRNGVEYRMYLTVAKTCEVITMGATAQGRGASRRNLARCGPVHARELIFSAAGHTEDAHGHSVHLLQAEP